MKMGTVSEAIIRRLSKDVNVVLSDEDGKCHDAAMKAINSMSKNELGNWGVIHEPWFEKCNNVSALIGVAVGASMVGLCIGIRKIVKKAKES